MPNLIAIDWICPEIEQLTLASFGESILIAKAD